MVRPGRDRLSGTVEVDETYVGALEEGVRGRATHSKALIAVAAQEDGRGIGRIRMRRIADASAESLMPFVEESIEPAALCIRMVGWVTPRSSARATDVRSRSCEANPTLRNCCRESIR